MQEGKNNVITFNRDIIDPNGERYIKSYHYEKDCLCVCDNYVETKYHLIRKDNNIDNLIT